MGKSNINVSQNVDQSTTGSSSKWYTSKVFLTAVVAIVALVAGAYTGVLPEIIEKLNIK